MQPDPVSCQKIINSTNPSFIFAYKDLDCVSSMCTVPVTSFPINSAFKRLAPRALRSASVIRFVINACSSLSGSRSDPSLFSTSFSSKDDPESELSCNLLSTFSPCFVGFGVSFASVWSSACLFLHLPVNKKIIYTTRVNQRLGKCIRSICWR